MRFLLDTNILIPRDHPEAISNRMHARDGVRQPIEMLQIHQDAEVGHAKYVTAMLAVPLVMLQAFDIEGAENAMRSWAT